MTRNYITKHGKIIFEYGNIKYYKIPFGSLIQYAKVVTKNNRWMKVDRIAKEKIPNKVMYGMVETK